MYAFLAEVLQILHLILICCYTFFKSRFDNLCASNASFAQVPIKSSSYLVSRLVNCIIQCTKQWLTIWLKTTFNNQEKTKQWHNDDSFCANQSECSVPVPVKSISVLQISTTLPLRTLCYTKANIKICYRTVSLQLHQRYAPSLQH